MSAIAPVLFEELPTANGLRIGIARLNAEKSLNSLTLEMIDLLAGRLGAWARDDAVALVLLEGAGERAFCAGADLNRLHGAALAHHAFDARDDIRANAYALDFFGREYRLDYALHTFPKPVLCWGHGVVMGGGMGLMQGASHRVVTGQLRMAMPEINIGLYADVGGSWFLARTPGHCGVFLALTAAQIDAADALYAGLADWCIEHGAKADVLASLAAQPWVRGAKAENARLLSAVLATHAVQDLAPGPLRRHHDLIASLCRHDDAQDVVNAIGTLAAHEDEWLKRAAATLAAGSPTTAILSVELQRRLRLCSLAEVFRAELTASLACAARPDLAEGIRALLIDKDRKPRWQPACVADVTADWIDGFFASPWRAAEHPLADLGR